MSNIEERKFYFIKSNYFKMFGLNMMQNKEKSKRPCYFCFYDEKDKDILWFIPVSTKVEKYKKIYEEKKKKLKNVYNFVFGPLHGKDAVFLIQNIFPTTKEYIIEKYITENKDVVISKKLADNIINQAKIVISMANKGINISFNDIVNIKKQLLENKKY